MSKPWGKIGDWAADVERAEDEERELQASRSNPEPQSFPTLREATATKPKKNKPISLSEFTTGAYVGPGGASRRSGVSLIEAKGLTPDEMSQLPTGPKERSAEEMEFGKLGGGFRNYGGRSSMAPRGRGNDNEGSWGGGGGGNRRHYGGFDDDGRRGPLPRASDYDQPSRADEVDNWATMKKPIALVESGRSNDRYSSLGSGGGNAGSRADEVDNWTTGKKPFTPAPAGRFTGFGSGFKDSNGVESEQWSRGDPLAGNGERKRLVFDAPRKDVVNLNEPVKTTRPSPFGVARPREEILTEKGVDWKKMDMEIEIKKTSSHSSRPESAQGNRPASPAVQVLDVAAIKPKPKVNPFGNAKPREILLQEKGQDWRKMDFELEHRGVDRMDTEEEKVLKEEIEHLKKELENDAVTKANGESLQSSREGPASLSELISCRERDLELLIRELDDKVRFVKRATDRLGSGAGRVSGFLERSPSQSGFRERPLSQSGFCERPPSQSGFRERLPSQSGFLERPPSQSGFLERPGSRTGRVPGFPERRPSQSGIYEDSRNMEFMDRPRSRGTAGDVWDRPEDGRNTFPCGRERGFFNNRDLDRPHSRERW